MSRNLIMMLRFLIMLLDLSLRCFSHPLPVPPVLKAPAKVEGRSAAPADVPTDTSIYVCQNYNFEQPCILVPLGPDNNGQQDFWMAPAPSGPGPFQNGNYTIGSWGPSMGVFTYWEDHHGNTSDLLTFPGTGSIDKYWTTNVWTFFPFWVTTT